MGNTISFDEEVVDALYGASPPRPPRPQRPVVRPNPPVYQFVPPVQRPPIQSINRPKYGPKFPGPKIVTPDWSKYPPRIRPHTRDLVRRMMNIRKNRAGLEPALFMKTFSVLF